MTTKTDTGAADRQDRRKFIKQVLRGTIAGSLLLNIPSIVQADAEPPFEDLSRGRKRFIFFVDITACVGCGACCRIDRTAYDVPASEFRTWVERYTVDAAGNVAIDLARSLAESENARSRGTGPAKEIFFVPKFCRMCDKPRCQEACPSGATYRTREGFVLVDSARCTGCAACVTACPHSALFLDQRTGTVTKCSWCHERLRQGLAPLCVAACPVQARKFEDLDVMQSELSPILHEPGVIRAHGNRVGGPALYYKGWRREVV